MVSNVVGVIQHSDIQVDERIMARQLTPVILCTLSNEPVMLLRCWAWPERNSSVFFQVQRVIRSSPNAPEKAGTVGPGEPLRPPPYVMPDELLWQPDRWSTRMPSSREDVKILKRLLKVEDEPPVPPHAKGTSNAGGREEIETLVLRLQELALSSDERSQIEGQLDEADRKEVLPAVYAVLAKIRKGAMSRTVYRSDPTAHGQTLDWNDQVWWSAEKVWFHHTTPRDRWRGDPELGRLLATLLITNLVAAPRRLALQASCGTESGWMRRKRPSPPSFAADKTIPRSGSTQLYCCCGARRPGTWTKPSAWWRTRRSV